MDFDIPVYQLIMDNTTKLADFERAWPSPISEGFAWSSSRSSSDASDDDDEERWKTSTKHWDSSIWQLFFPVLLEHGYHLIIKDVPLLSQQDSAEQLAAASELLTPYDCLRLAVDTSDGSTLLYVKALIPSTDSQEIEILEALNTDEAREELGNHTIRVRKIIRHVHDDLEVVFIVQEDGGLPLFELDANSILREDWQQLVLSCFEGLAYLHCKGVAHLDVSSANILYTLYPGGFTEGLQRFTVSFIDFEGSRLLSSENHTQDALVGKKLLAVNARLPELGDKTAIDPFAADVWQLADMFLQMERFPSDDLTALFRFMAVRHPQARPTIHYALAKLRCLLSGDTNQFY